jgi:hypothetical protein
VIEVDRMVNGCGLTCLAGVQFNVGYQLLCPSRATFPLLSSPAHCGARRLARLQLDCSGRVDCLGGGH